MSEPSAGTYYIVNEQTASDGTTLALTFNGTNAALTVTKLMDEPNQLWNIIYYSGNTQRVVLEEDTGIEVGGWSAGNSGTLKATSSSDNIWGVRGNDSLYTFQDTGFETFWGIKEAAVGQDVYYGTSDLLQYWKLVSP